MEQNFQVGDIVKPWGNRATSNKVSIQDIVTAKVIKPPKKIGHWDTKFSMVIEILGGKATSVHEGRSNSRYDEVTMPNHYGRTQHVAGSKVIVFVDSFQLVAKANSQQSNSVGAAVPNATHNATQNTIKGEGILSKNISKRTLLCMLG